MWGKNRFYHDNYILYLFVNIDVSNHGNDIWDIRDMIGIRTYTIEI